MGVSTKFRTSFSKIDKSILHWFPGHMVKGMKQMQQRLKNIDCVIEVHDARIPVSGRNQLFKERVLGVKPHILVLNKCDLTDGSKEKEIRKRLKETEGLDEILFTDCRTAAGTGVRKIIPTVERVMYGVNRYNRKEEKDFSLLVIGVPNVGKSSLINVLRNLHTKRAKATPVGAVAGVTRSVMGKIQVCYHPPVYLLDTPGILEPSVGNVDDAMRLALCATMKDSLIGTVNIADYMLFWLNKNRHFSYVDVLGLPEATDNILELLTIVAEKNNYYIRIKDPGTRHLTTRPDFDKAAGEVLTSFRMGKLGKYYLDNDRLF